MVSSFFESLKFLHFGNCKKQKEEMEQLKKAVLSLASERTVNESKMALLQIENCELKIKVRELEANEITDLPNGI